MIPFYLARHLQDFTLFFGGPAPINYQRWAMLKNASLAVGHEYTSVYHFQMRLNCLQSFTPFFHTCQVRVVRFYQSCSSPSSSPPLPPPPSPPPPLPPLQCSLPPCQLFAKLFANFCTQWALLDLNCKGLSALGTAGPHLGPSELSEHRWTSTWDRPSSVSTAGPQPGTLRAQWAPLDLNLGPSELSEHRWTSTARYNARRYVR